MKKTMTVIALLLVSAVIFAQNKKGSSAGKPYTIQGTFSQQKRPFTLYMTMVKNEKQLTDSVQIKDGKFRFTGLIEEPTLAKLWRWMPKGDKMPVDMHMLEVFLDPGKERI